ncbi:MAG: L,D-transpeptidase family protein [Alphaproteobacteria bacterium]|nr:L,D-transpeptidase family protein [Alphaproteobacteria bacterium]
MIKSWNSFLAFAAVSGKLAVAVIATFAVAVDTTPADAAKRRSKTKISEPLAKIEGPLTLLVSLQRQRVVVYDKNGPVTTAPISSGTRGHRTPTGVFTILQKRVRHYSNLYGGAPMPNMQRITWSGIALHAGHLPGYPASHGCIRLPYSFSSSLFKMTEMGSRVIVTDAEATPQSFAHDNLLRPLPPGDPQAVTIEPPKPGEQASNAANMLLGVTPAHASEHQGLPDGIERTRAAVEAYRAYEIQMLDAAVEKAEATKQEIAEELKAANAHLDGATKAEKQLVPESAAIDTRLKSAEDEMGGMKRKFRDFILRASALNSPVEYTQAAYEETALEEEALRHLNEFELARADRAAFEKVRTSRQEAVRTATERRDTLKERYVTADKSLSNTVERLKTAKQAFERRERPITVLLSKHSNKLYVRQGYDPVLEADITFDNPDAPLGTHVFHAVGYTPDGSDLSWQSVTAARKAMKITKTRKSRKTRTTETKEVFDPSWPAQTPANALNRVKIPDEVREYLAELMKPGSAIIVTDESKSHETGKYTDLIVLTN